MMTSGTLSGFILLYTLNSNVKYKEFKSREALELFVGQLILEKGQDSGSVVIDAVVEGTIEIPPDTGVSIEQCEEEEEELPPLKYADNPYYVEDQITDPDADRRAAHTQEPMLGETPTRRTIDTVDPVPNLCYS